MKYIFYFRHPKTKNEMWQFYACIVNESDIPINIRGRRKPKCLPNAWDDICRPRYKNWKYFRKHQWKMR
jgi:hypothetical protein